MEKYVEMQLRKKEAEQQQRHATVEDNFDGNNFKTVDSVFEIGMFQFVCSRLTYLRNTYKFFVPNFVGESSTKSIRSKGPTKMNHVFTR